MLLLYGFGLKTVNYFTTHWPASQPGHGRKVRQARPTPDSAVGHKLYFIDCTLFLSSVTINAVLLHCICYMKFVFFYLVRCGVV